MFDAKYIYNLIRAWVFKTDVHSPFITMDGVGSADYLRKARR